MTVYTAITNGKDSMPTVQQESNVDYVCFSDVEFSHPVWTYQPVELLGESDSRRIARRYKILSHLYFPGQETIWIDGRVNMNKTATEMFDTYTSDISARPHPSRECIYDEAEVIIKQRYDNANIVNSQMDMLKATGYPAMNGLNETGILLRRPTLDIAAFNSYWWLVVSHYSKRDQLSFNFAAFKMKQEIGLIDRQDVTVVRHRKPTNIMQ